ncbi:hypothetical protein DSUL_20219 [Desulfovibrionales bacterium]
MRIYNLKHIRSVHVLGLEGVAIVFRHILPNVIVVILTFMSYLLGWAIVTLIFWFLRFWSTNWLGHLGRADSLGEEQLLCFPWIVIASSLVFIGDAVRDAFDPSKDYEVFSYAYHSCSILTTAASLLDIEDLRSPSVLEKHRSRQCAMSSSGRVLERDLNLSKVADRVSSLSLKLCSDFLPGPERCTITRLYPVGRSLTYLAAPEVEI